MKQHAKWSAAALALAGCLAIANSAQAQAVTGTPYLSNMDPSTLNTAPNALYPSWDTATINSLATGLEVNATGYGSLYYVVPNADVQTLNANDAFAQLTFTVNGDASAYIWVGTPFILNDNSGASTYGGLYSGSGNPGNPSTVVWNGNTVTWTVPLSAAQLAAVQTGTDAIYGFNLEFDPAVLAAGNYDVTFNSLVITSVPEPASLALMGLGAAALLVFRRRA
jgi:PEP-CTERM motif